jgi:hypothetical protein
VKATDATLPTDPSSDNRPPSRTSAESFALSGRSDPPDPDYNAFRKDLADVALAGSVLASHYAEPADRLVSHETPLLVGPADGEQKIAHLCPGEPFAAIEDCVGWVWGYAGESRRVGYVRSDALGPKAQS